MKYMNQKYGMDTVTTTARLPSVIIVYCSPTPVVICTRW